MAFQQAQNITVTGIGDIAVNFLIPETGPDTGGVDIQLKLSNGEIKILSANLLARLADDAEGLDHLANLVSFRNYLKNRANTEVLP